MQTLLHHPSVINRLQNRWSSTTDTHNDAPQMTMDHFTSNPTSNRWTTFANDDLAPIVYPNICRSLTESYKAFDYVNHVPQFSMVDRALIRYIGALAMYIAAGRIKAKRNIVDEREALHDALSHFEKDGLDAGARTFSSGLAHPGMGDIAVFGTLFSVRGLDSHVDAVQKRGGVIGRWYERMEGEVAGR